MFLPRAGVGPYFAPSVAEITDGCTPPCPAYFLDRAFAKFFVQAGLEP
jgi:hypothetical protein